MIYISRVKLRNWKNFKGVEASLGPRVFLIGPNASGKSNLLDVFRFLRDVAGDGLRKATEDARGGMSSIRCLAATRYTNIDIEIDVTGTDNDNGSWTYRLVLNQDNLRRPVVREETVSAEDQCLLSRPDERDRRDPLRLTQTALEQISANQPFRGLSDFLKSVAYQHILPQVVRDPRGFSPLPMQNDPFGRDFLLRVWRTQQRTRDSRLRKISAALQAAVPQLAELKMELDDAGTPHLIGGYSHWRPHPARQSEGQFSDGTLRLFGLLWTVFEGGGPLLVEEPEISLHPEVVRRLPTIFGRTSRRRKESRQVLISTHSEDMLRDEGVAAEEVLRLEPSADGTQLQKADAADCEAMRHGLTAADVLMPKAGPENVRQLTFEL